MLAQSICLVLVCDRSRLQRYVVDEFGLPMRSPIDAGKDAAMLHFSSQSRTLN